MLITLLLFQVSAQAPDIELNARVQARSVTIEKQGNASLTITTDPEGANVVDVRAPKASGQKTLRNVDLRVRAEARIAEPGQAPPNNQNQPETTQPQHR